jgi:thioredoxin reductase (NADPH)
MSDQNAKITVYGAPWCPDCRQAKKFLTEQLVRYNWKDIDQDEAGRAFMEVKNNGKRIIPTIVFEDGSFMVEPSNAELAKKLGLQTKPQRTVYDLVVIGGGRPDGSALRGPRGHRYAGHRKERPGRPGRYDGRAG